MIWIKRGIVYGLDYGCAAIRHGGRFYTCRWLARWADTLDQRWHTGLYKGVHDGS